MAGSNVFDLEKPLTIFYSGTQVILCHIVSVDKAGRVLWCSKTGRERERSEIEAAEAVQRKGWWTSWENRFNLKLTVASGAQIIGWDIC